MKCPECQTDNPADSKFCKECATPLPSSPDYHLPSTKTLDTPIRRLMRGTTFAGRYEFMEELGKGGMGKVYKVFDNKLKEEIALKVIRPEIASDEKSVERFRNELKIARKIVHKNIARMYDLGETGGTFYIAMEYIRGENLKSLIKRVGFLPPGKAVSIACQMGEGLAEAHRKGVVHRDLKPSNIMVDDEGNARIMDFGIARSLESKGITGAGVMIGTPEYMSPEQVEGEEADQRSDIYSLGVVLFEMVAGRIPFEGKTSLSIALKHKTDCPPDPREFNAQIPEELSFLILKCMEKEKIKRYQSAEELLSGLNRLEDKTVTRERVFPGKRFPAAFSRKIQRIFLISIISLSLIILIASGFLFFGRDFKHSRIRWETSIAVLPFEDQSQQKDQEAFCEEMTIAVINRLSSIDTIKVTPYYTMRRYRDRAKSHVEIGRELDVKTILVSYFKKEEDMVSIIAELVNSREGYLVKSFEYYEKLDDIRDIQDKLSGGIASTLGVAFKEEQLTVLERGDTRVPKAYDAYVKGSHFVRKYRESNSQGDFESGVRYLENAREIDGSFALPFWGLGLVYEARFTNEWNPEDQILMEENFRKAYEINPDLAEANAGLGWVAFFKEDMDSAYRYFKKALEISPNDAEINSHVASFLRDVGLNQRALEIYSKAMELDPMSSLFRLISAMCYRNSGEFEKAAILLREAVKLEPDNVDLLLYHARQLIMIRKYCEAEAEIAEAERLDQENPFLPYLRAWILAARGERDKALEVVRQNRDPVLYTYFLSNIYSILGMKDEAIHNIEMVIERGFRERKTYPYPYTYLIKNPFYDGLRDDRRFKEIVKKQEREYRERLKKYGDL